MIALLCRVENAKSIFNSVLLGEVVSNKLVLLIDCSPLVADSDFDTVRLRSCSFNPKGRSSPLFFSAGRFLCGRSFFLFLFQFFNSLRHKFVNIVLAENIDNLVKG